ncbi:Thiol:disulfide interchange protein DsbD [Alphaproteobacteria bacterium SO-S41]|nr:Thiol:disulfide interchange protein DsbD [Alphaproteobacteria bacterium SO-S41]
MRRLPVLFVAALAAAGLAGAQDTAPAHPLNVQASLVAETEGVQPGDTVTVALRFQIREHWHTYWINPGDSGEATTLDWTLPEGVTAGPLQFPYPQRIQVGPLVNFGFSDTVLHLTDIKVPDNATVGQSIPLKAHAVWLVCDDICVPEEASVSLDLPVVAAPPPPNPSAAAEFAAARAALPMPSPWPASFAVQDGKVTLALKAPELAAAGLESAVLFPVKGGFIKNAAPQAVETTGDGLTIATETGRRLSTPEKAQAVDAIDAVMVVTGKDGQTKAFELKATPGPAVASGGDGDTLSVWTALGFAFLGGLILNLMPCVFPVLSMKALALAKKGGGATSAARAGGFAYTAGVVLSFLALGGVLIAIRGAGEAVGWGFQLQSPVIVAALALVFFAIGLNLMGVFEVGTNLQNLGNTTGKSDGLSGSFLTGVLAAVVAAPCTAPFMGGAIFTALTQPIPVALAIFGALGLGMAAPYLALTLSPGLVRRLPKPGLWMERLKQVLAFPMFGSTAWLVWVLSLMAGPQALALSLAALIVTAFGLWLWGIAQRGEGGWLARGTAIVAALAVIAALVVVPGMTASTAVAAAETSGPKSEPYSPARLDALLKEGKPVFVNLTAAWCVTCLVNEEVALSSSSLASAFEKAGIVYLKGDWTNRDADISKLLEQHGRAGVPLYLFYKPGQTAPAILPQLLTEGIVLDAIGAPSSPSS